MADRVVLHVGTMKSGTSYLQSALQAARAELDAAGCFFVGDRFGKQSRAVQAVIGRHVPEDPAPWETLAQEARERPGRVAVFSMEFLSLARRRHVEAFLRPLEGIEIDVVLAVRDQFRAVPAQWQTYTRNFGTDDWGSYLRHVEPLVSGEGESTPALRTFRQAQDARAILNRWGGHPLVSALRVLTVPPPGAAPVELWHRFCRAARVDVADPPAGELRANESLGYASCDLLRRLNSGLQGLSKQEYRRVTRPLALEALAPLRDSEGRPELDRQGAELALALNRRVRQAVRRAGVEVVGSLEELPVTAGDAPLPEAVPPADPEQVRRAALVAWAWCAGDEAPPTTDLEGPDGLVAALGQRLVERADTRVRHRGRRRAGAEQGTAEDLDEDLGEDE